MEHRPLVSIIMPNYNGARFVEKAIFCVLTQTYSNIELIVVDDKSTDLSVSLIERIAKQDNRVQLIKSNRNNGVAVTRNIGIQAAQGEYIALFDNDDLWEPDKIERQMNLIEKGADIVYCSYDFIDENGAEIKRPFVVPTETNFKDMLVSSVISCSTALIRADLLKEHPFNPTFYHEDYVLWMELLRIPSQALGDQKILMHYRQVTGSRSNKKWNAAKERWNIYRSALRLNFVESVWAFVRYSVNGVLKYYL